MSLSNNARVSRHASSASHSMRDLYEQMIELYEQFNLIGGERKVHG
jgi:hypothetical protein